MSPGVRHQAALCLGLLSRGTNRSKILLFRILFVHCRFGFVTGHLSAIAERFLVDLANAKTDTSAREYATYARAHRELKFGWQGLMQSTATLRYFEKMLDVMQTTERGVLRGELCAALRTIYPRVMGVVGVKGATPPEVWEAFQKNDASRQFWATFKGQI